MQIALLLLLNFILLTEAGHCQALAEVKSFGYQLQGLDVQQLAASPFDLLILDYSHEGDDDTALRKDEVESIIAGKQNRIVVSYFSIGEAEEYRYYFKSSWIRANRRGPCKILLSSKAPEWLDQPNRAFCGNYKTRYWQRAWQRILFGNATGSKKSYLDKIIDAGYQGVYLDIIDGYEYWLEKRGSSKRKSAAKDMAVLVERISTYARTVRDRPDFIVIPQNGAGILNELNTGWRKRYLDAIDGIGAEDTFYFGPSDEDNLLRPQLFTLANLMQFQQANKPVFAIDYLTDRSKIDDFRLRACNAGFVPQIGTRSLNALATQKLLGCNTP